MGLLVVAEKVDMNDWLTPRCVDASPDGDEFPQENADGDANGDEGQLLPKAETLEEAPKAVHHRQEKLDD